MRLRTALAGAACGGVLAGGLGVVAGAPARAADPVCDSPGLVSGVDVDVLDRLDVGRARALAGKPPTPPVRVAVLDSGVTGPSIPVVERETVNGGGPIVHSHGTAVAGLIAGAAPVGIAPDAEIVDVRVYDSVDREDGAPVTTDAVAAGLEWVARNARDLDLRIANVSLAVERDPAGRLEAAVRAVRKAGVIVVAASGNRPQDGDPFDGDFAGGRPGPGEDAAGQMFPTGFGRPLVVSVNATADGAPDTDATTSVLLNSATTVAAPTYGARTYGLDGRPCVLESVATSWAAAEVSGLLALLWQRFPDETDEQIVARLVSTANGTPDGRTALTGAGVVQPVEALTRPLAPDRSGDLGRTVATVRDAAPAVAPDPEVDPLAGTRHDAVWWGLIGGGVLVIALLLRPVIARRRT